MTQRRIFLDQYPYFVTTNVHNGRQLFSDAKMASLLSREIFISSKIKGFDILSYQIMPDHFHLLVYKQTSRTLEKVRSVDIHSCTSSTERTLSSVRSVVIPYNISDLMQSIKGNFSRKLHIGNIWQRRFYAKLINTDEYLATIIEYIRFNPTKAKLYKKYHRMPYQFINPGMSIGD